MGARIRDVRVGPDGFLYLLTDAGNGKLLQVELQMSSIKQTVEAYLASLVEMCWSAEQLATKLGDYMSERTRHLERARGRR